MWQGDVSSATFLNQSCLLIAKPWQMNRPPATYGPPATYWHENDEGWCKVYGTGIW
jgi:hypothetical protein